MCSVGVISYVRRLALRPVRERRGRGVSGSEVATYVVPAGGGRLWARGLTGPCLSCLFSWLRSRCALQAILFCSFFNSYSAVYLLCCCRQGRVPTSQDMVLLLVNDSSVTHLNLEAVFGEGNIHVSLFLYFISMQAKGAVFIFLKEGFRTRHILNGFSLYCQLASQKCFSSKWKQ